MMPRTHGDTSALTDELHWVQKLARAVCGDDERARDLTQDAALTWLRRRPPGAQSGPALRAWLKSFVTLASRGQLRRDLARQRRERLAARPEALPSTADVVERCTALRRLAGAVQDLEEPYRTALVLRFADGLSHRTIAERTGVSVPTVRKRVSRGVASLRRQLEHRQALIALPFAGRLIDSLQPTLIMTTTKTTAAAAAAVLTIGSLGWVAAEPDAPPEPAPSIAAAVIDDRPAKETSAPFEESTPPQPPSRAALAPPDATPTPTPNRASRRLVEQARPAEFTPPNDHAKHNPKGLDCKSCHSGVIQTPQPDGYRNITDVDGNLAAEGRYEHGVRTGLWLEYREDGKLAARGDYFGDKRHGPWTMFHANGAASTAGEFLYGKREGVWRTLDPEGRLLLVTPYRDGRRHGVERRFDENGDVTTATYVYGNPLQQD